MLCKQYTLGPITYHHETYVGVTIVNFRNHSYNILLLAFKTIHICSFLNNKLFIVFPNVLEQNVLHHTSLY